MSSPTRHHSMQAFGLAILIEAALVAGAAIILVSTVPAKPALSEPVPITLETEEPPPEKPEEPKPLPPPPVPQPKAKAAVKPVLPKQQTPPPQQETPPVAQDPAPVAAAQTAFTEPAPAPVKQPPPAPSSGKFDPNMEYAAKVHAAVQAAHYYPPAAAAMRFSGRVRVEFHLRDGIPGESHVLVSCGIGMIDHAALQAVQSAHYPEPPVDMRGHDNLYQVWVEFTP
jgi:protein TonB